MDPLVAVVILSYNRRGDTLQAIGSLQQMTYVDFEILLVDNHSIDGTAESVRAAYPCVRVLALHENVGFAAGANTGIRCALELGAAFILVMNNDVSVHPSMLTALVKGMVPGVGISGPKIYYMSDPKRIWSNGFRRHPLHIAMRGGVRGQVDTDQRQETCEVDYLLGCAMLFASEVLEEVGLFDERFFFFYEDLDLCLRAQRCGYRIVTVPEAKMWHKVSASAGLDSPFRAYHMARGSVLFYSKHARGIQRPVTLLFRTGSAVKTTVQFLAQRRHDLVEAYWRGVRDGALEIMSERKRARDAS